MAKGPYMARTFLHLPGTEVRKSPGETVTYEELQASEQSDEQIDQLYAEGALGDLDGDIDPAHQPVDLSVMTERQIQEMAVIVADKMGDDASPEVKALAATFERGPDDRAVLGSDVVVTETRGTVRDGR